MKIQKWLDLELIVIGLYNSLVYQEKVHIRISIQKKSVREIRIKPVLQLKYIQVVLKKYITSLNHPPF